MLSISYLGAFLCCPHKLGLSTTIKRSGCFFLCIYGITRYISGGE